MARRTVQLIAVALLLLVAGRSVAPASSAGGAGVPPSLLAYNTVQGLLAGDLEHTVSIARVRADLAAYPPDWPVVGVGTTNQPLRTGELMPAGTAGDLRFWWADPDSASQAAVTDIGAGPLAGTAELPFLALGVGDPTRAVSFEARDVADVHAWLSARLAEAGIELAGVLLVGEFGPVKTTVSYNIPGTGLDLSEGYVGADYFRFGDYAPAAWRMTGIYTSTPALQPVIAAPGQSLHIHGFQPAAMLGGHITSAAAERVRVIVYPLDEMVVRRGTLGGKSAHSPRRCCTCGLCLSALGAVMPAMGT